MMGCQRRLLCGRSRGRIAMRPYRYAVVREERWWTAFCGGLFAIQTSSSLTTVCGDHAKTAGRGVWQCAPNFGVAADCGDVSE